MNKLVYCAHPIDQAQLGTWRRFLDRFIQDAASLSGVMAFDPQPPWSINGEAEIDPRLDEINREVIKRADALVAFLPAGVGTIGTPREIELAKTLGIPWIVLTDIERSWSLADALHQLPLTYEGVHDALEWIRLVVPGVKTDTTSLMTELAFSMNNEGGRLPTRSYSQDAGFDLYVHGHHDIAPGAFVDVDCGVRVVMPPSVYGRITGRSSTMRTRKLLVIDGVIDGGWRGPLFAGVQNLSDDQVHLKDGDRIAQLILHPNVTAQFEPTWISAAEFGQIPHDGRGVAGFGSSGA